MKVAFVGPSSHSDRDRLVPAVAHRRKEFVTMAILDELIEEPGPAQFSVSPDAPAEARSSAIKTIVFHVHDDETVMDRLALVVMLAQTCAAHVYCLHVTPIEAYTVVDSFGWTFANPEIVDALKDEAAKLKQRVEAQLALEQVPWNYEETTDALVPTLVQRAALTDVVITGRQPRQREFGGPATTIIDDLLAQIRTPLMVTGNRLVEWDTCGPAVIAWNGSYEAANAVRNAMPFLQMAGSVNVVEFNEHHGSRFPLTMLLEYLSRHGVLAKYEAFTPTGPVSEELISYAAALHAGMIVLGGYSHSRAGEFLFGGVTRALLTDCPIALLISH
jgi:nucleotide-binding universal stress UspA family protein